MKPWWTDEQNRLLEQLCGEKLGSTAIAVEINRRTGSQFTRNAVIGRARRVRAELPIVQGSHGPRARAKSDASSKPEPLPPFHLSPRWKPGRILARLGWLDGGFR